MTPPPPSIPKIVKIPEILKIPELVKILEIGKITEIGKYLKSFIAAPDLAVDVVFCLFSKSSKLLMVSWLIMSG